MYEWSETDLMIRDAVRAFIDKEIRPNLDALESGELPPYPVIRKLFSEFGIDTMARESVEKTLARERAKAEKRARILAVRLGRLHRLLGTSQLVGDLLPPGQVGHSGRLERRPAEEEIPDLFVGQLRHHRRLMRHAAQEPQRSQPLQACLCCRSGDAIFAGDPKLGHLLPRFDVTVDDPAAQRLE